MRAIIILGSVWLAACSGGEEQKTEELADGLAAGQWEVASEVSAFRSVDKALPALKAAAGDKSNSAGCVEKGKEEKPKAELFAGTGYECKYRDSYISGGRLNATLECDREAIDGKIMMTVQGSYTATGFEAKVDATSSLPGEGDFAMSSKVVGRHAGDVCAAPTDEKDKGKAKA